MRDFFTQVVREIFRLRRELLSLPRLVEIAGAAVVVVGLLAVIRGDFFQFAKDHSILSGVFFEIVLLLFVLVLLYGFHATALADDQKQKLSAAISNLEEDKRKLAVATNWHDHLAQAIGVHSHNVSYKYEITDYDGNYSLTGEEDFDVTGITLNDIVRPLRSSSATGRSDPFIDVLHLPNGVAVRDRKFDDIGGTRYFRVRLTPPLDRTPTPALLLVKDNATRGFYMTREQVPADWLETPGMERAGHIVVSAIGRLTISVQFPLGYQMDEADTHIRVTFGRGTTRHEREEFRLKEERALHFERQGTGEIHLRLEVAKPIVGLRYFLCWVPMTEADLNRVKTTLIAQKEREGS